MHQFDEHHSEFKGFSKYFHEEILQFLDMQDAERLDKMRDVKTYGVGILVFAVMLAIAVYFSTNKIDLSVFVLFLGAMGILVLYSQLMRSVRDVTKDRIVGGICNYIGWRFQAEVTDKPNLALLEIYGLIPKGFGEKLSKAVQIGGRTRASFEDQMSGQAHGAEFNSVETHLQQRRDDSWTTIFRGQVMTLTFPKKFLGQTVVLRDKGRFQRKEHGEMKRVGLVDPVFEKIFEAYSTDQVESRYLLDPHFMQKLVDLERSVDGKNIRFGFLDGQLFIVVETPNRYEAGSMLKPITSPVRTQKILNEIGAIYDIVDAILAPDKA